MTCGTTGPESMATAANIFRGSIESPLLIQPHTHNVTNTKICTIMSAGLESIASWVMIAYIGALAYSQHNV